PGPLHALVPRVRATVGNDGTDVRLPHTARDRPQLGAAMAAPVRRSPGRAARERSGTAPGGTARGLQDRRLAPSSDRRAVALAEEARRPAEPRAVVARRGGGRPDPRWSHPPGGGQRAARVRDHEWRRPRRRRVDRARTRAAATEAARRGARPA